MASSDPVFFYDARCGFCTRWAARWRARTGERVRFESNRKRLLRWRLGVSARRTKRASVLVESSGRRSEGAEAVFRMFLRAPGLRLIGRLGLLPGVLQLSQLAYRLVAKHRQASARIDGFLFGDRRAIPSTTLVRWLYLRAIGLIFLGAFLSLHRQVAGLYGRRGIRPLEPLLDRVRELRGPAIWRDIPSLLWLGASDERQQRLLRIGEAASGLLALNVAPRLSAAIAGTVYLSFTSVGGEPLGFQWDALLLENALHVVLPLDPRIPQA